MYTINRAVAIVKPEQPFLDWLHSIKDEGNEDITLKCLQEDCSVYLLPEADTFEDHQRNVAEIYEDIFEDELNAWYVIDELWPVQRDYDTFKRWFTVEIHTVVYDPWKIPLSREEL